MNSPGSRPPQRAPSRSRRPIPRTARSPVRPVLPPPIRRGAGRQPLQGEAARRPDACVPRPDLPQRSSGKRRLARSAARRSWSAAGGREAPFTGSPGPGRPVPRRGRRTGERVAARVERLRKCLASRRGKRPTPRGGCGRVAGRGPLTGFPMGRSRWPRAWSAPSGQGRLPTDPNTRFASVL